MCITQNLPKPHGIISVMETLQKKINKIFLKIEDGMLTLDDARLEVFTAIEEHVDAE